MSERMREVIEEGRGEITASLFLEGEDLARDVFFTTLVSKKKVKIIKKQIIVLNSGCKIDIGIADC